MKRQRLVALVLLLACGAIMGVGFYRAIFSNPLFGLLGSLGLMGTIMALSALWNLRVWGQKEGHNAAAVR